MHVLILGCRGVPSRHSGFETFAEDISVYLRSRGHEVTVYCQAARGEPAREDTWNGVRRVVIPAGEGPWGTIEFDWKAILHARRQNGIVLTLGYNTGLFNLLYRFGSTPNVMNMDGIEWKRAKWSLPARMWFWLNERAGARVATHLVADHPEIGRHLGRHTAAEKITVIPYGADALTSSPVHLIERYGLRSGGYDLVIARPEPENSILEIIQGHSLREGKVPLMILGKYSAAGTRYQRVVLDAAAKHDVIFPGAIYDRAVVRALRLHARIYFHGHQVGGTNPSLVEALAAGNAIVAHDNCFTRWVAGEGARYFRSSEEIDEILDSLREDPAQLADMREASRKRHAAAFTQEAILPAYEEMLLRFAPAPAGVRATLSEVRRPVQEEELAPSPVASLSENLNS